MLSVSKPVLGVLVVVGILAAAAVGYKHHTHCHAAIQTACSCEHLHVRELASIVRRHTLILRLRLRCAQVLTQEALSDSSFEGVLLIHDQEQIDYRLHDNCAVLVKSTSEFTGLHV